MNQEHTAQCSPILKQMIWFILVNKNHRVNVQPDSHKHSFNEINRQLNGLKQSERLPCLFS